MNFSKLSLDELWESSCYNSFAAIEVNRDDFVARFGEQQLLEFQDKLEHAGFSLAGSTNYGTLIFSFPTPLRDSLREEIEEIIEGEIFA
jgi:hypothetical protein